MELMSWSESISVEVKASLSKSGGGGSGDVCTTAYSIILLYTFLSCVWCWFFSFVSAELFNVRMGSELCARVKFCVFLGISSQIVVFGV